MVNTGIFGMLGCTLNEAFYRLLRRQYALETFSKAASFRCLLFWLKAGLRDF